MLKGAGGGGGGVCASVRVWVRGGGGGGKFASLVFNKSLSRLAILLAQRRSFQRSRRIFLNLSIKKWKKKVERSINNTLFNATNEGFCTFFNLDNISQHFSHLVTSFTFVIYLTL